MGERGLSLARTDKRTENVLRYLSLAEHHYKEGRTDLARVAMSMASALLRAHAAPTEGEE